jgi:TolB protein
MFVNRLENSALHQVFRLLLTTLLILLAGCGPGASAPTPQPAIVSLRPRPTQAPVVGPPPTVVAEGSELPGRLLFVVGGNLWLWRGQSGGALTSAGNAYQPAWSPDGAQIAYVRRDESSSDLMVMPAIGGEPVQLTSNGSGEPLHSYERIYASMWTFYPAWSPDGAEIAFASQAAPPFGSPAAEYRFTLYSLPSAGGERQQIYADEEGHVGRLAYAPNGTSIVFAHAPAGDGAAQLYRYARAASSAAPLLGAPEQSYDPAFSPDGRWLAFAARDPAPRSTGPSTGSGAASGQAGSEETSGRTDVFAMPAAGGSPVRLTSLGGARAPAFSPDGKLLAFLAIMPGSDSFDLWVVDLQLGADSALRASAPRQITHDMRIDADSGLSWSK